MCRSDQPLPEKGPCAPHRPEAYIGQPRPPLGRGAACTGWIDLRTRSWLTHFRPTPHSQVTLPLLTGHLDREVVAMGIMTGDQPVRRRRSFTDEFKADAVAMVLDEGRRIIDVANALGIGDGTLGNWVKQARIDRARGKG